MIAFKEYAKAHNTSYETVRRTVAKNEDAFREHIIEVNRVRYLDEEGERLLDEMRGTSPQVLHNQEKRDEKENLEQLTIRLQNKIVELEERLNEAKDQIIERDTAYKDLQARYIALLEPAEDVPEEEPVDAPEEVPDQPQEDQPQDTVQDVPERPRMTFGQRLKFLFTGK